MRRLSLAALAVALAGCWSWSFPEELLREDAGADAADAAVDLLVEGGVDADATVDAVVDAAIDADSGVCDPPCTKPGEPICEEGTCVGCNKASSGCPGGMACLSDGRCRCSENAQCATGVCSPWEERCHYCASDGQCTDPGKPVCDTLTGVCQPCTSNSQCASGNCRADGRCECKGAADCATGLCGTTCERCKSDADCDVDPKRSICDPLTGACRGCREHSECAAGLCAVDGTCPTGVIFLDDCAATRSGDELGTDADPYCRVADALEDGSEHILVKEGTYGAMTIDENRSLYAESGQAVISDGAGGCAAVSISADVTLVGFTIGKGGGGSGGVLIGAGVDARLQGNTIGPSGCVGVKTGNDGQITLRGNYIAGNTGGGVELGDVLDFELVNNIIAGNGSAATTFGGVKLKLKAGGGNAVFSNNTVYGNSAKGGDKEPGGVRCEGAFDLVNSVVWGNTPRPQPTGEQISSTCAPTYCALEDTQLPEPTLIKTTDLVLKGGTSPTKPEDYRPLLGSPCIDAGQPAGAPPLDFFGLPRHGKPDVGAIEY